MATAATSSPTASGISAYPNGGASSSSSSDAVFKESESLMLEWKMTNLKALFEGSKGDAKSRVVKSALFGGGKWQVLFYPNAGGLASEYTSLYLSCEPSWDEYEDHQLGGTPRWIRKGTYQFKFVIYGEDGKAICTKEASNHTFASKTANWGWASFSKRDLVYYHNSQTIRTDTLTVSCVISASPTCPPSPPSVPHQAVPRDLLSRVGSLLDNPNYSDVEFIIAKGGGLKKDRRSIYANKTMLSRADYFETMLSSGFSEGSARPTAGGGPMLSLDTELDDDDASSVDDIPNIFEDSDEDDDLSSSSDPDPEEDQSSPASSDETESVSSALSSPAVAPHANEPPAESDMPSPLLPGGLEESELERGEGTGRGSEDDAGLSSSADMGGAARMGADVVTPASLGGVGGDVLGAGTSSRRGNGAVDAAVNAGEGQVVASLSSQTKNRTEGVVPGPRKTRVVVRDAAYPTFYALLHYLYTDSIIFAPLTSSFIPPSSSSSSSSSLPYPNTSSRRSHSRSASAASTTTVHNSASTNLVTSLPNSHPLSAAQARKAWLNAWVVARSSAVGAGGSKVVVQPASAKSIYVLADKMGLGELKKRAFDYIVANLTVYNISYEAFSPFTAAYDEVRSVEVAFFLKNWNAIKRTEGMTNVWASLRSGRSQGFEQVFPLILSQLKYDESSEGGERDVKELF